MPLNEYSFLPFRFNELDKKHHVLTNLAGEYVVLEKSILKSFIDKNLSYESPEYKLLRNNHFLIDKETSISSPKKRDV